MIKKTLANVLKNNLVYYVTEVNNEYKLTKDKNKTTDFNWKFLFFSKKCFHKGICKKFKTDKVSWVRF